MVNKQSRIIRTILTMVVTCVLCITSVGAFVPRAEAAVPLVPFGGRSLAVTPCTCNGCLLIAVGPPRGGLFMYCPFLGSRLYMNGNLFPLAWQLGRAFPVPVACLNPVCSGACCPTGAGLLIDKVGTSVF